MSERDIFTAAREMTDPVARSAYLDGACGADTGLRTRVEALLRAHDQPDSLLDQPALAPHDPDVGTSRTIEHEGGTGTADEVPLGFLTPATRPDALGRIGHYEVLQVLGQGGFGIVFRAFDDVLHRIVAVKVLSPQMAATSPARRRFLREARSSAQVRHENVVQVYEVGEQPLPYIAMEFIPGETLQQRLDRVGPVEPAEVVRVGRQIAEGLAAAHATDLIHRDIKPGNVLLEGGAQRVKITDFGLARAADDASISQSGIIAGTPMYMAPEQAKGDELDQRADLFSLGSVLYQMAAGRPPFRANGTLAVLKRVAEDTPRPIREIIPETPPWLCDIISKLHAKNPDDRYQSAREVADVLADCEAQLKANARLKDFSRIPRSKQRAAGSSGRWKWVAAAALLLAVLALAVTEIAGVTQLLRKLQPTVAITPKDDPEVTPNSNPRAESKTPPVTGRFALAFDGKNSRVMIPSLKISDHALTVEAWTVLEQPRSPMGADLLGNPDRAGFALAAPSGYGGDGKKLAFMMRVKDPDTYVAAWEKRPVPRHQLIHLAGVYDGKGEIRFYLDGQLQSRTPAQGIKPSNKTLCLGGNWFGSSMFLGRMNEVRISRSARYDADFTPATRFETDKDTLTLYHCDEGEGTVLRDSSDNGHHGEIVGAKWVKANGSPIASPPADAIAAFTAGDKPPAKDLFTGRALTWMMFDDPITAMKNPDYTYPSWQRKIENGLSVTTFDIKKPGASPIPVWFPVPAGDVALATRFRCENTFLQLVFREWPEGDALKRLAFNLRADGSWSVSRSSLRPNGTGRWFYDSNVTLATSGGPVPALANGTWVTLAFRLSGRTAELWANGRQLARFTYPGTGPGAGEVRQRAPFDGHPAKVAPGRYEIAYIAVWELPAAPSPPAIAPFTDADARRIAALPVAEQVQEVRKELMKRNPEFNGSLQPTIEDGVVTRLTINGHVTDLSPLRGMKLTALWIMNWSRVYDLTPLRGMPLEKLCVWPFCGSDLTPLKGMPLKWLNCGGGHQKLDLAALAGLSLEFLCVNQTKVSDLTPLKDMPLMELEFTNTAVTDVSPLKGIKTLEKINKKAAAQFWKGIDPVATDPNRRAAEYVLSIGGAVKVNDQTRLINDAADLPREPFRLTVVDVHDNKQVTDAGLAAFKDCEHVTQIFLWNSRSVTDAGLAHFARCRNITQLHLQGAAVSDAGLAQFKGSTIITHLYMSGPLITDVGLAHFKDCKGLVQLYLGATGVTDAGLAQLKEFKNLRTVNVYGSMVTDAGLAHLAGLDELTELKLGNTKVTAAGVEGLAKALPKCKITWDGGVIEAK